MKNLININNHYKVTYKNKIINLIYLNKIWKNHKSKMNKYQKLFRKIKKAKLILLMNMSIL